MNYKELVAGVLVSLFAQQELISQTINNRSQLSTLEQKMERAGMIDVCRKDASIRYDLKYATTDNFTRTQLYDTLRTVYLHPLAAQKLVQAQALLKKQHPHLSLLVWDAARPLSVQQKMYKVVANTPLHEYVASPTRTGLHNYGCAVDLTICNADGKPLDMGTPFDFFGKKASIRNEVLMVSQGLLTRQQVQNRQLLRKVMTQAGFIPVRGEWWHFNALTLTEAKKSLAPLK